MTKNKKDIRYGLIKNKVQSLYLQHKIDSLPIRLFEIIKTHKNWRVWTYRKFGEKRNLSPKEVIDFTGSLDGCAYYQTKKDRFLILYNDDPLHIKNQNRINWTIAHEIGHIVLNHHSDNKECIISRNTLSDEQYKFLEKEANYFASNFLAPVTILKSCEVLKKKEIISVCKLSDEAATYKEDYLANNNKTYVNDNDIRILKQFHKFIHRKHCKICGYIFYNKKANYCPICGGPKLKWEEGTLTYDDGYDLNENGKAYECPACGNSEMLSEGRHCRICGKYLINKCTREAEFDGYGNLYEEGCSQIAHSNSRFCEYCGAETTFFRDGLLKKWDEVKNIILAKQEAAATQEVNELNWKEILEEIKKSGHMVIYTNLMGMVPKLVKNTLYLTECGNGFSKIIISKTENIGTLEKLIGDYINKKIKIRFSDEDDIIEKSLYIAQKLNIPFNIIEE